MDEGLLEITGASVNLKGQELMRWRVPENRCELWTGERWVDLERDVLQPIGGFVNTLPGGKLTANDWPK